MPTTLYLRTSDGVRLEALTLAPGHEPQHARWILFFHGSAHSIHNWRVRGQLEQLRGLGFNVLAPEYRGFGRNEGTPTESGLYEDAMTAYRYVTAQLGVPPSRVVAAGRSLGSAVAVELASRVPMAGVMLLSPIDSIVLMGTRMYPWVPVRLLASSRFDSLGKIGRVGAPVVVIHAADDRWVPIEAARALFAEARSPKLMLETLGGHNGAGFEDVVQLRDALAHFWPAVPQPPLSSGHAAAGMSHRTTP
jgi:pimeloyl-ACP methyl ester carboxylesterase